MQSIFDDEDMIVYRQARQVMPMLAPMSTGQGYLIPATAERLTYIEPAGKRKRTVGEALERLEFIAPRPLTGLPYGVQRALRRPMMVYTAAWFLAAGFVIVDPLDRLEGGLID